jgi:hypothetical protein
MPDFAIYGDDNTVVNVIVADSAETAGQVCAGMSVIETNGDPWIGWTLADDGWRPPQPFPSWLWGNGDWQAPVPHPGGNRVWDEASQVWVPMSCPYHSWTWDDDNGEWIAPTPYPDDEQSYTWDEDTLAWIESAI